MAAPLRIANMITIPQEDLVENRVPPDIAFWQLGRDGSLLFRIKVVDESGEVGRILPYAKGIRPRDALDDGINLKSLFPVQWKDLGELIWRVDYNKDTGAELQLTTRISNLPVRLKPDALVQGAIYPQALREVLSILLNDGVFEEDLEWVKNWYEFVGKLTGTDLEELSSDDGERESFIEDAVRSFTLVHRFDSRAKQANEATQ
jgi:hypothetical protein